MRITEEERAERMERIVNAAFLLFCRRGIEKVTLLDVAKEAGVGEATVYRYFTNKVQLVLDTMSILWVKIGSSLEVQAEELEGYDELSGYEQFKVQLDNCKNLYLKNKDYVLFSYEAKLYLLRNHVSLTKRQYDSLMEVIRDACIAALEKGRRDGSIQVQEDNEDLFYAVWGAVRGYVVKIVIYGELCGEDSPWEQRYDVMETGVLCALLNGWKSKVR